jgi:hypothetical protein
MLVAAEHGYTNTIVHLLEAGAKVDQAGGEWQLEGVTVPKLVRDRATQNLQKNQWPCRLSRATGA